MAEFVLYGADYSVYTRIPRLVLEEAGVPYRLDVVDIFADDGPPSGYLDRHPFAKIPALEHDGFEIFETDAIVDYIVSVTGVGLVPGDHRSRARMRQIMRIADNYAYPVLVWDVYVREHLRGSPASPETLDKAERILSTVETLIGGSTMTGETFSLADCWMAPIVDYFRFTETGRTMMDRHSLLSAWWSRVSVRPSVAATAFVDERADQSA